MASFIVESSTLMSNSPSPQRYITMVLLLAAWSAGAAHAVTSVAPPSGCAIAARSAPSQEARIAIEPAFPVPLEMRTPVAPAALSSGGRHYLFYEIHLANLGGEALSLRGIEVSDAARPGEGAIATFGVDVISASFGPIGFAQGDDSRQLAAGQGAVAFLCVAFDAGVPVPSTLRHRVLLKEGAVTGPSVSTRRGPLPVLGRPVTGKDWIAKGHPAIDSHHRTGLLVVNGSAQISRRYAIDWKISKQGATFAGDPRDVKSYYAYGREVLAMGAGVVVAARDGMPDNVPRTPAGFTTAVPVTLDTASGNHVVVSHGAGQYAFYAHLQPGSVSVRKGDRVRRGQQLGRIGNSGDARDPHLHFQLSTAPHILASEGLPYLLEHYRVGLPDGGWQVRKREFPLTPMSIDFGDGAVAP